MTIGWNVGNSLEVPDGETAWGNPMVTRQLIDAVHEAGFNTLRIPCAWNSHADQSTLEIDQAWLARVKEVVDYGYANGMYVILNSHWDNGWLEENPYYSVQDEVNQKQKAYWTQIANYFQNYDEHLLFAGTNEVHHGYDAPSAENIEVQQSYLQTFVDAVRATGGNNASRTLIVQTYNTNIWHGFDYFEMPTDTIRDRLIVEVHHYDPYDFTLNTNNTCIYWGSPYPSQSACSWAQESYIDDLFSQVNAKWTANGIPVIMGEYGAIYRTSLNDPDAIASREYWLEYNTKAAIANGVIPIYWDNGYAGDNGLALFDRSTGTIVDQGGLTALINAATGSGIDPIAVTGITVSESNLEMETGETHPLSVVLQPADATDQSVTWTSSDPAVASVSSDGLVKAVTLGNATITATTRDGSHTAACAVTVIASGEGGDGDDNDESQTVGGTGVTVTMDADKPLTANSSNDSSDSDGDDDQSQGCATQPDGLCVSPQVRISQVEVGVPVVNNASETQLKPLMVTAIPSGGSWLAWMGDDNHVYIGRLDCDDALVAGPFSFPANDFQDIAADDNGGVILLTRNADGGGTLNCGQPTNLCDGGPDPAIPCYGMYMVRFNTAGEEQWATQLTTQSAQLPPYSTGPDGPMVHMIWWYQHHGRLAWDGSNFAAYFCEALSVSQNGCINIHEGDRMQVVDVDGRLLSGHDSVDWGCSHSWNTRMVWDDSTDHFSMVCATDRGGGIAQPNDAGHLLYTARDLGSLSVGDIVADQKGGYWITASDQGSVRLMHFADGTVDSNLTLDTSPHSKLAAYGSGLMVAGWGSESTITAQVFDVASGNEVSSAFAVDVPNNIYQPFKAYPDGSVAYAAPGDSTTEIRIARILPCT